MWETTRALNGSTTVEWRAPGPVSKLTASAVSPCAQHSKFVKTISDAIVRSAVEIYQEYCVLNKNHTRTDSTHKRERNNKRVVYSTTLTSRLYVHFCRRRKFNWGELCVSVNYFKMSNKNGEIYLINTHTHHSSSERRVSGGSNKHTAEKNNKTLTPIVKNKYNARYVSIDTSFNNDVKWTGVATKFKTVDCSLQTYRIFLFQSIYHVILARQRSRESTIII